jgi:hypothetical protein
MFSKKTKSNAMEPILSLEQAAEPSEKTFAFCNLAFAF